MWLPSARLDSKMKKGWGGGAHKILEQNETMWKRDMVGSLFSYRRLRKKNHGEMLRILCKIKRE